MRQKKSVFNSIQVKWSIGLLVLTILPLLASTIFFTSYFSGVIKDDNEELANQALQINLDRIDDWIKNKTGAVEELIAQHDEIKTMNPEVIFPILNIMDQSDKQSEGYSIIDNKGILTNMINMTADMSKADYFLKAKETKAPSVADMSYLEQLDIHIIPVIVPIVDDKGEFLGGIAFSLTPEVLMEVGERITLGDSGYGYFISGDGVYYTSKDATRIGKNIDEFENTPEEKQAFETILNQDRGSVSFKENGQKLINYFGTVPNTDWKLIITVPESEIYGKLQNAQGLSVIIVVSAVVVVALIALFLSRFIVKPIVGVSNVMKGVADGDLQQRVSLKSKDEIGQMGENINLMIDSLSGIVQNINSTVGQVSTASSGLLQSANQSAEASGHIASAISEVAFSSNAQLQSSEQSTKAMEEMSIGVQRISETATEVSEQTETVTNEVESGYTEIQAAITQMNVIGETSQLTATQIKELDSHSEQIGQIVDVISTISRQTALLALNASIEAARAGEHGRGFAVVANEVKKLAEQTNESISSIAEIVTVIQNYTASMVQSVDKNIVESSKGISRIEEIGERFQHIRLSIREVFAQMQDVSATTQQLSAGSEEITASVEEMFNTAKESAANAQSVSNASEQQNVIMGAFVQHFRELDEMMLELKKLIQVFKV